MVTADLRESVMKARMQPVSNVFSKMPRMVRDLSQMLGRRVRLEMEGQETELDKSLLEAIKDPLTHAVRNAIDHGIETPDVRLAAGKNPEGTLKLRAAQEGSHVIVEVSDDGAGIKVEKVRDKAIERGIISAERAANSSDRELLQLVFVPGREDWRKSRTGFASWRGDHAAPAHSAHARNCSRSDRAKRRAEIRASAGCALGTCARSARSNRHNDRVD